MKMPCQIARTSYYSSLAWRSVTIKLWTTNLEQNQFMQEHILAVVAEDNQDDEDEGSNVEALYPAFDNDLLARVAVGPRVARGTR